MENLSSIRISTLLLLTRIVGIFTLSVSGPFLIQNMADGYHLDLEKESRCIGVNVVTSPLSNKTTQMWDIYDLGAGYMVVNRYSGLVLDIANGGLNSNSRIIVWAALYSCNQRWAFDSDGTIRSGRNNLVMDVCNPARGKISSVISYPKHGGRNQQFRVLVAGSLKTKSFAKGV